MAGIKLQQLSNFNIYLNSEKQYQGFKTAIGLYQLYLAIYGYTYLKGLSQLHRNKYQLPAYYYSRYQKSVLEVFQKKESELLSLVIALALDIQPSSSQTFSFDKGIRLVLTMKGIKIPSEEIAQFEDIFENSKLEGMKNMQFFYQSYGYGDELQFIRTLKLKHFCQDLTILLKYP
ncbi:unnamed protein product [Paramecium octaurelia]|uniref:Uncharacterized protein n=1 Tax=Paramecium octaurelia TaxID=43137 RepID=A0A8S1YBU2_PAROT|nr:unnamed protein product [Paramecium octaurelia]